MSDDKPDNLVKLERRSKRIPVKPGRIARARAILLDAPLPPSSELEREAVNGLRQIIRDEDCIPNARVGACRTMLEYVDKLEQGGSRHEQPQTAQDWEAIEQFAREQKERAAG